MSQDVPKVKAASHRQYGDAHILLLACVAGAHVGPNAGLLGRKNLDQEKDKRRGDCRQSHNDEMPAPPLRLHAFNFGSHQVFLLLREELPNDYAQRGEVAIGAGVTQRLRSTNEKNPARRCGRGSNREPSAAPFTRSETLRLTGGSSAELP